MSAAIALSAAQTLPRRQAARTEREFSLFAALSTALQLAREVGDSGTVNAKTIARVRQQILAA